MATSDTGASPAYPLGRPAGGHDPRFTYGLIFDLAEVLQQHGYPPPAQTDWAHLAASLHQALYQHHDHDQEQP